MGLKSILAKPIAAHFVKRVYRDAEKAVEIQEKTLVDLLKRAKTTRFGRDHRFAAVSSYQEYKEFVPVRGYEELRPYIDRMLEGEDSILWPGRPLYYAKTSGTTSGSKYIPISKDSMSHHITAARNGLLHYVHESGNAGFFDGKMIFLQGSPELENTLGVPIGRLSGIVYNHVPSYLLTNRKPGFATNCIEDWERKLDRIVDETIDEDMRLISGIPPWVVMYLERLLERSKKKTAKALFPNFSVFAHGGVNYAPYRERINELIGFDIPAIETYPASEGFIAYQDSQHEEGLLLNTNAGIFFEFIPADQYFVENAPRIGLADVQIGVNYALVLSTNAGLWAYSIGDTVRFVSLNPHRIVVTGRIKHFISAFGEHVIAEEVERSMAEACHELNCSVVEFTVAPKIQVTEGLPHHEWFVEFLVEPDSLNSLEQCLDRKLCKMNAYYHDLRDGNVLQQLKIVRLENGSFKKHLKSTGKLGGQNKVARLANDRSLAEPLSAYQVVS